MEDKHSISQLKIVEINDDEDDSEDEYADCELDEEVNLKFKENVLKNKSVFQKQLLDVTKDINPDELFELPVCQENEGDEALLESKMDLLTLDLAELAGEENTEDESNRILSIAQKNMKLLPGFDGVYKRKCQSGEGGMPPVDSIVTVHYNGYAEDDVSGQVKTFDSTVLRGKPMTFMRGQGAVLEGLDIAIGSMQRKEQAEFVLTPEFAYGALGCPPRIPPNAYIFFRVDLIDWVDSSAAEAFDKLPIKVRKALPFMQVLDAAKSEKRKAKSYFEKQNYLLAGKSYQRALNWIQDHGYANEDEEKLGLDLSLSLLLNLALISLKNNRPKKTCSYCKDALVIDPDNVKAYYRFGLAQEKLGDFNKSRKLLVKAKGFSPNDASIARALLELDKKIANEAYIEKDLYRKMMGKTEEEEEVIVPKGQAQEIIRRQLAEYLENNNEKELVFPQCLSKDEKIFLQAEAQRLQLKYGLRPTLYGEGLCYVSK